jgi:Na+/H+ antiporter NhaD/arsenite permease-like protein
MERTAKIRDKELLWDCVVVLSLVIVMFFVHSVPVIHLNLGWIAVLGGLCFPWILGLSFLPSSTLSHRCFLPFQTVPP